MKKFCERCGKPLLKSGKCVDCDKVDPKVKKKSRVWIPIVVSISVVAVAAAAVAIVLSMGNGKNGQDGEKKGSNGGSTTPTFDLSVPYEVTPPDAEELLNSYGEILSTTPVQESDSVQSGSDAWKDLYDRGLSDNGVMATFDMFGAYLADGGISRYSSEEYPMYSTFYTAANGEVWVITSINGNLTAEPMSYNNQEGNGNMIPVMITESDSIYSYDPTTNCFFDYVPDESSVRLMKVKTINAETLDGLTSAELGG